MKQKQNRQNQPPPKKRRALHDPRAARVIFWAGAVSALLYVIYLARVLFTMASYRNIIAGCVALIVIVGAVAIRKMAVRPVQRLLAFGLCFFLVTYAAFQIWSLTAYRRLPEKRPCVVLVLGCRVNGWEPSRTLAGRLDAAAEILSDNPDAVCVVSGGKGDNELQAEGDVMKRYLTERGIDPSRIYAETLSYSTEENIKNSFALLEAEGLSELPVVVVSSSYHITRAQLLCVLENRGIDVSGYGSMGEGPFVWVSDTVREYMALWKTAVLAAYRAVGGTA